MNLLSAALRAPSFFAPRNWKLIAWARRWIRLWLPSSSRQVQWLILLFSLLNRTLTTRKLSGVYCRRGLTRSHLYGDRLEERLQASSNAIAFTSTIFTLRNLVVKQPTAAHHSAANTAPAITPTRCLVLDGMLCYLRYKDRVYSVVSEVYGSGPRNTMTTC